MPRTVQKFKVGDRVELLVSRDGLPADSKATITGMSGTNPIVNFDSGVCGYSYPPTQLKLLKLTKESLEEQLKEAKADVKHIQGQLAAMEEFGMKEYDENICRVYQALTTIEDKSLTKKDKAMLIADLMK